MNYVIQNKKIKPNAKCCDWCKNFSEDFECKLKGIKQGQLTHRLVLKLYKENEFRYCKNYRYSKVNFKRYKKICKENISPYHYDIADLF